MCCAYTLVCLHGKECVIQITYFFSQMLKICHSGKYPCHAVPCVLPQSLAQQERHASLYIRKHILYAPQLLNCCFQFFDFDSTVVVIIIVMSHETLALVILMVM
ncbi:unnamed protein product [Orchesella dallaii]|uniref:Uncharacterized protein n=1 Tax=Orchesella dallaii TaxID=48710 RepID=A0ABP1S3U0_9HEXA